MPSTRHYLSLKFGQLHFRCLGDPSKPALILLHQTPSASSMYEAMMPRLAENFYVLAPDTPGFGQSEGFDAPASIVQLGEVIAEFIEHLCLGPCFLFGHHTGAAIAAYIAAFHAEKVRALSMSGPPLLSASQKTTLPNLAAPFEAREDGSHLHSLWARMRGKDPEASLELSLREMILALDSGDAYQDSYRAVVAFDMEGALKSIGCATQIFAAQEDTLKAALEPALALLQQGEMAELNVKAGTYVCDRYPQQVADLLMTFFGKHYGS
jgi:pimeloyl-ACP methyl ester carboxylesterase